MPKLKPAWPPLLAAAVFVNPAFDAAGQDIENVVVTASRVPIDAAEVGSSMSVVSRADLDVRQPTFVADALRDVPGLAVSRGGGFGAVTQVRIRGAEGNHALVLIDGVEANNPVSNSEFDFANLALADIERIEILRGPQSALYGSDAIGGVINVITRERDDGFDARATVEGGSFGTHAFALSAGSGTERYGGGLHVSRLATDGENIARAGNEKDGFENDALTLDGRALLGAFAVNANVQHIDSAQEFDTQDFSFPAGPTQGLVVDDDVSSSLEQWFARVQATADFARVTHRLAVSGTSTENTFLDGSAVTGRNEGDKTKVDYQATLDLGGAATIPEAGRRTLTLALERELVDYANRGASPDAAENQTQDDAQTSIAAEYRRAFARASFSASARFDDNDLFDDASTYRLTGAYRAGDRTRLHSSLGTGIANPGFFELFGFFPGSFIGNPALVPEHSTSFDFGVERLLGADTRLDVTYFRADLEDEIETTFDSSTFLSSVRNLRGESERRGVELSIVAGVSDRWQVAASYTYTHAEQPDGGELRRPRHVASLDNTLQFLDGRARLHFGVDHTGAQLDTELVFATPEERVEVPAFTLVKVSGDLRLAPRLRVYGRIENLLGEEYEEWFSYRGRGRALVAGFAVDLAP